MPHETTLLDAAITWFFAWLPMFLLIGVWLFYCWKRGLFARGAMTQSRYLEEILNETKTHNAVLAALMTKMDARLSRLESEPPDAKKPDV